MNDPTPAAPTLEQALEFAIDYIDGGIICAEHEREFRPHIDALQSALTHRRAAKGQEAPVAFPPELRSRFSALEDEIAAGKLNAAAVFTRIRSWFNLSSKRGSFNAQGHEDDCTVCGVVIPADSVVCTNPLCCKIPEAAPAPSAGWRPISEAPKDGTLVDLWVWHSHPDDAEEIPRNRLTDCFYRDGHWCLFDECGEVLVLEHSGFTPSYFCAIPVPPAPEAA